VDPSIGILISTKKPVLSGAGFSVLANMPFIPRLMQKARNNNTLGWDAQPNGPINGLFHMRRYKKFIQVIMVIGGLLIGRSTMASDSIPVNVNGRSFKAGDSIHFSWNGQLINKSTPTGTLHLWIDNLETGQRWKLRYPILNGETGGSLAVSRDLRPGTYAFNFLAAENFLEISGKFRRVKVKTAFNYETRKYDTVSIKDLDGPVKYNVHAAMLNRMGLLFDEDVQVAGDGSFRLPPIVFGDTARLVFDTDKMDYLIDVRTLLDTSFVPFYSKTMFISVKADAPAERVDTSSYQFNVSGFYPNSITLQEVVVTGPSRTKQFEDEHVTPMFKHINSRTLSSLDNDQLLRMNNIWSYIQANAPGIMVRENGLSRNIYWRGQRVSVFQDEIQMNAGDITVPPSEVALIKIFPAGTAISARAPGGVIAIYTKRGDPYDLPPSPYTYAVKGYTQPEILWQ
jgi:hypothetical protein